MIDSLLEGNERINESVFSRDSLLTDTSYNNDFQVLEDMGYKPIMIKKVYAFLKPNSLEQAIEFMTQENGIYLHNYFKDYKHKRQTCYICGSSKENHLNFDEIDDENDEINENENDNLNDKLLENNGNDFTCNICGENYKINSNNITKYELCGDEYCNHCWFSYLRSKIEEGYVNKIKCMNYQCKEILSDQFIRKVINSDKKLVEKYEKFLIKNEILNSKNKKFCPVKGCDSYGEKIGNNKYVTCQKGHKFCYNCLKDWHGKKPCEKNEEEYFQIWKKGKIIKQCPNCKMWTEKNEGCNHMTCAECKYQWCWLCNGKYEYGHYSKGTCNGLQFYKPKSETDIENILKDNPHNLTQSERRRRAWKEPNGLIFFKYYDFYNDFNPNDPLIRIRNEECCFLYYLFLGFLYLFCTFEFCGIRIMDYNERNMRNFDNFDCLLIFILVWIVFISFCIFLIPHFFIMLFTWVLSFFYYPLFHKLWIYWYFNIWENAGIFNWNNI